jgi:hypothetical protein
MFNQFQGTLEKGVVTLFAEVSFGASGAPTLVRGKGIASVSRTSTGLFVVTLQDSYILTLGLGSAWKGTAAPAGNEVVLDTDGVANGTPAVTLKVYTAAGALVDPASGESVLLSFTLSNSTAL